MKEDLKSKYIVWVDRGYEGWSPYPYSTLEDAIEHATYGSEKVITSGALTLKVSQVEILEDSPTTDHE